MPAISASSRRASAAGGERFLDRLEFGLRVGFVLCRCRRATAAIEARGLARRLRAGRDQEGRQAAAARERLGWRNRRRIRIRLRPGAMIRVTGQDCQAR